MDFNELFGMLREPGEDGAPDTIYDDIQAAYNNDLSIRDAKVAELDAALQAAANEISQLKSANYDLMMAQAASGSDDSEGESNDDPDSESDDPIDSLFDDGEDA